MTTHQSALIALFTLTALTVLPSTAFADRSTSLQGNRLIQDPDDVFTYPHLSTRYTNSLRFDLGTDGSQGNALFLMGDESFTWGVALHRGNMFNASGITGLNELNALGPLALPLLPGSAATTQSATIADLLFGFGSIGVRVSLGSGLNSTEPAMGSDTDASSQYINLAASYGLEQWDLGLHAGFINTNNDVDDKGATQLRAAFTTRGYLPMNDTTQLGVLGRLGFISQSSEVEVGTDTIESSALQISAVLGAGPSIALTDQANIAAYATLGFAHTGLDPNTSEGDDSVSAQQMLLPGANVAMEIMVKPWLRLRAGMEYNHAVALTSQSNTDGSNDATTNAAGLQWNAGVGIVHENLTFDGTFNPSFLTQGPDFIGGDGPLFAVVSMSYRFGGGSTEPAAASNNTTPASPKPQPTVVATPEPVEPMQTTEAPTNQTGDTSTDVLEEVNP